MVTHRLLSDSADVQVDSLSSCVSLTPTGDIQGPDVHGKRSPRRDCFESFCKVLPQLPKDGIQVQGEAGKYTVSPQAFTIKKEWSDSHSVSPLLFCFSVGSVWSTRFTP